MVDSATMSQSRADRSTLIKAQFSALNMTAGRGTSDETEATHQCVNDQVRSCRLRRHAICMSVIINLQWEET